MKKIVSTMLALSMLTTGVTVGAKESKSARTEELMQIYYGDTSDINIVYNDKLVNYEDVKPINNDGRVMIPFRAALENMGAEVEYNANTKLVTAQKGDTTITFTLMDDIINIDKAGEKSLITMDTPMIVIEGRTLVPIRFMSNAFGMQVGWDGDTETVLILDIDEYFKDFGSVAPNFSKLCDIDVPKYNDSYADFDVKLNIKGADSQYDIAVTANVIGKFDDNASSLNVDFDTSLNEKNINDLEIDFVVSNGKLYFKTNIFDKLEIGGAAASFIKSDEWYSLDVKKALEAFGFGDEYIDVMLNAINGGKADVVGLLKSDFDNEGDTNIDDILTLAVMLDLFEQIDKYITIDENDEKCTVSFNLTTDNLLDIMKSSWNIDETNSVYAEWKENLNIGIKASSEYNAKNAVGDADIEIGYGDGFNFKLTVSAKDEIKDNNSAIEIPSQATDLTEYAVNMLAN